METMIVNMSSTNVGSNATYQCRDGPTDVYTTQCTSTGVWYPYPYTLECAESNGSGKHLFIPVAFCKTNVTVILKLSLTNIHIMCLPGEITLQPSQVGVIILSLIVLVQTGLLVGALVKIVLLTKKGETLANCPTISELCHNSNTGSEQKAREERLEMDVNVAYGTPKEIMACRTSKQT